ncbi:basic salivary proline-rich protein 2-like [Hirundo rustica]|uniref:basic salivary proline-rich protein 2-like n=1 Tax=Hirundo rustica TaxID=43150 RepID=UPI001A950179|nr:basic salivary proline-rich protein 2-like [Hirundo rustica]
MRPGARRHQGPPPLPGLPGAGPPQPSAGKGETRQPVPWRSRRIPPIRRLLRARLRLLPPPPRIPEPPDSLAASAARGEGRAGPAPARPLAAAAARQHRPHLIEGLRPLGHAPSPPGSRSRSRALTGAPPIGPRPVSSRFPLDRELRSPPSPPLLIGWGKGHDTGQGRGGGARGRSGRAPPGGGRRRRAPGPAPTAPELGVSRPLGDRHRSLGTATAPRSRPPPSGIATARGDRHRPQGPPPPLGDRHRPRNTERGLGPGTRQSLGVLLGHGFP